MADHVVDSFLAAAHQWYEGQRTKTGSINTNVMTTGLVVSQKVSEGLPITDARLYSPGKSQVQGLSGSAIAKILERHGEIRLFTREGGRTSRGTYSLAGSSRDVLNHVHRPEDFEYRLSDVANRLESFFVDCVRRDYFDKQRITVDIEPAKPVSTIVSDILATAAERSDKPTGTVLQHLVGAKLQLRFPDQDIGMDHANAADLQTDREGDFQVGNTAFHVTVSPMEKLIDRCIENKRAGYRPVILTTGNRVQGAIQMLEIKEKSEQVAVQSAEVFIGTNIEEIAVFESDRIREGVAKLIRQYNKRIDAIEVDKSFMIEEPRWLANFFDS